MSEAVGYIAAYRQGWFAALKGEKSEYPKWVKDAAIAANEPEILVSLSKDVDQAADEIGDKISSAAAAERELHEKQ